MSNFYHIPWEVGEKNSTWMLHWELGSLNALEVLMVTPSPSSSRIQNQKHEVCWGFSHRAVEERRPWASLWMGLGVHLTSLVCGNLAEVQAATMARWPGDRGPREDQVGWNMQRQAGSWGMFQGVKLMPFMTLGTAWWVWKQHLIP